MLLRSLLSNLGFCACHGFKVIVIFVILELAPIRWHQIVATIAFGPPFCFGTVSDMFQNDSSKGLGQHRNRPETGQEIPNNRAYKTAQDAAAVAQQPSRNERRLRVQSWFQDEGPERRTIQPTTNLQCIVGACCSVQFCSIIRHIPGLRKMGKWGQNWF